MEDAVTSIGDLAPGARRNSNIRRLVGAVVAFLVAIFVWVFVQQPHSPPPIAPPVAYEHRDEASTAPNAAGVSSGQRQEDNAAAAGKPLPPSGGAASTPAARPTTAAPNTAPSAVGPSVPPARPAPRATAAAPAPSSSGRLAFPTLPGDRNLGKEFANASRELALQSNRPTQIGRVAPGVGLPESSAFSAGQASIGSSDSRSASSAGSPITSVTPAAKSSTPTGGFVDDTVYWNYWLDQQARQSGSDPPDPIPKPEVGELVIGAPHHLQFRLTMLDLSPLFANVGATAVSKEVMSAVTAAAADPGRSDFTVGVAVHSVGNQLLKIEAPSQFSSFKIDLAQIRGPLTKPETRLRPGDGKTPILQVIQQATIGQFGVDFVALAPGTHQMGITLVDQDTGYPLQSLIVDITTGKLWPQSIAVDAGASSIFQTKSAPFDLALFIYDLKASDPNGYAPNMDAELWFNDPETGQRKVIAWRTDLNKQVLQEEIKSFHGRQTNVPLGEDLLQVGLEFGGALFRPSTIDDGVPGEDAERNRQQAKLARRMILARANYPEGSLPPTMIARVFGNSDSEQSRYASLVLPIGGLGIYDEDPSKVVYLGERFALSLLLAGQDVSPNTACPAAWHVALPSAEAPLEGPLQDAMTALGKMNMTWPNEDDVEAEPLSLKPLHDWIYEENKTGDTFVFAYLGHHDTSRLYLDPNRPGIAPDSMRRNFNGSSVAILNACEIALDHINAGTVIGKLAKQRVASSVAPTSTISGNLAASYLDCLRAVLDKQPELTIGQAHALTTQCLWSPEKGARWGRNYEFSGEALKYLLIGNPFQKICAPAKRVPSS